MSERRDQDRTTEEGDGLADLSTNTSRAPAGRPPGQPSPQEGTGVGTPDGRRLADQQTPDPQKRDD